MKHLSNFHETSSKKLENTKKKIGIFMFSATKVKFALSPRLIEVKIPLKKCFSNFWGVLGTDEFSELIF